MSPDQHGQDQVNELIAALRNGTWRSREEAAIALGEIGDPRAIAPLTAALRDEDRSESSVYNRALLLPPIEAPLWDKEWRVRKAAAIALGQIGVGEQ